MRGRPFADRHCRRRRDPWRRSLGQDRDDVQLHRCLVRRLDADIHTPHGDIPSMTAAVWVGYPNRESRSMAHDYGGKPVYGGTYPALIWRDYMMAAIQTREAEDEGKSSRPHTPPRRAARPAQQARRRPRAGARPRRPALRSARRAPTPTAAPALPPSSDPEHHTSDYRHDGRGRRGATGGAGRPLLRRRRRLRRGPARAAASPLQAAAPRSRRLNGAARRRSPARRDTKRLPAAVKRHGSSTASRDPDRTRDGDLEIPAPGVIVIGPFSRRPRSAKARCRAPASACQAPSTAPRAARDRGARASARRLRSARARESARPRRRPRAHRRRSASRARRRSGRRRRSRAARTA